MIKRAKKVYKQKLTAHYHHCKLRFEQKSKNTPLLKNLIPGASVDETKFRLDQVSTNQSLLHFQSSLLHFFLFFGGAHTLKKVIPTCMQAIQEQLTYARGKRIFFPCTYATGPNTAHVHPQTYENIKNASFDSPLNLSFC